MDPLILGGAGVADEAIADHGDGLLHLPAAIRPE
jgi:hypothetical protein